MSVQIGGRTLRLVLGGAALIASAAVGALLAGGDDAPTPVTPNPGDRSEMTFERIPEIVDEVNPSIVAVIVEGPDGRGEGSGVVWRAGDVIVTNHHVASGADEVIIASASGRRFRAEVRAADPFTDLAVLDAPTELPPASFADELPDVGDLAVAMGNPLSFENSVTAGIVSGLHRSIPSGGRTPALVDLVQTDAAISPGNSGGGLVGADGRILGINVAFIPPERQAVSIGFAIPAPTVTDVVAQLLETGEVRHAFLGIRPAPITEELAERFDLATREGAIVVSVVRRSAADDAGLRPGDIVVALAGEPVRSVEDLFATLRDLQPGETVSLTFVRDGDQREIEVVLDERPEPQS